MSDQRLSFIACEKTSNCTTTIFSRLLPRLLSSRAPPSASDLPLASCCRSHRRASSPLLSQKVQRSNIFLSKFNANKRARMRTNAAETNEGGVAGLCSAEAAQTGAHRAGVGIFRGLRHLLIRSLTLVKLTHPIFPPHSSLFYPRLARRRWLGGVGGGGGGVNSSM